ncbi:MAG: adenylate/guanylate cyclase domain-containing protein, partial [Pseudomonadota bacterium]
NLARYFSPRLVDSLAQSDDPLGAVRTQKVAVLFADVVGFTRLSEQQTPEQVIGLLRGLHERLEAAVFEHRGSLDKYLGDGVMATFGTPSVGPRDAADALECALKMLASVAAWNRTRAAADALPIRLSIGIHYGEVVLGDVGSARRLEFAVIGDVVNVASRLEALTREIGTPLLVSGAVIEAIEAGADPDAADLIGGLRPTAPQSLRGRERPVAAWALRADIG